jgi:hypothetical protein
MNEGRTGGSRDVGYCWRDPNGSGTKGDFLFNETPRILFEVGHNLLMEAPGSYTEKPRIPSPYKCIHRPFLLFIILSARLCRIAPTLATMMRRLAITYSMMGRNGHT